MQMTEEGKSPDEIQRYVDRKYARAQDQRTRTPLPPVSSAPRQRAAD